MALVDANYRFIYVDIGVNGRVNDAAVYRDCSLATAINTNTLNLPSERCLPDRPIQIPFVIVADDAFPLQEHIMKPFPSRGLSPEQRVHNYRLSRARRVSENCFGILANRFRIFLTTINLSPDKVQLITQAACALHNFLSVHNDSVYLQSDARERDRNVQPGDMPALRGLVAQAGNRTARTPIAIRQEFCDYFSGVGRVAWQDSSVM